MFSRCAWVLLSVFIFTEEYVSCYDGNYILKTAKFNPRIEKRNKANSDDSFQKFFLKASKSVPRIGRRGSVQNEEFFRNGNGLTDTNIKNSEMKYPVWSELAERYEYEPELFTSPHLLEQLEQALGDDPSVYDWDKVKFKRASPTYEKLTNKEINEYKYQV